MKITCLTILMRINLVTCALEIKNVDYTYFTTGEDITLKCHCRVSYWSGPSIGKRDIVVNQIEIIDIYGKLKLWNISIYSKGNTIADTLPPNLSNRLNLKGDNFDLHITHLSSTDEGLYICDSAVKCSVPQSWYLLQNKLLPSTLEVENITHGDIINGIENVHLNLICLVKSGKPPEELRWKKNGKIIKKGGPSKLDFLFVPNEHDHKSAFTCEAQNSNMDTPLTKTIHLDIKYKPLVKINASDPFIVTEGETLRLCCISRSNPQPISISWFKKDKKEVLTGSGLSLCYEINNVSRRDTGNYTCCSQNKIGNASIEMSLIILYPPVISIRHSNLTGDNAKKEIWCMADGEPTSYLYFSWEHRSLFNEHIRYLGASRNGGIQLPEFDVSFRYEDTGIYICNVSNGVPDTSGNIFQQGSAYLVYHGPPVFTQSNTKVQFGTVGYPIDLAIYVYSISNITSSVVSNSNGYLYSYTVRMLPIITRDSFYGRTIRVHGRKVVFSFPLLSKIQFQLYVITLCNIYGNNSFQVEIKHKANYSANETLLSSQGIAIVVLLIIIAALVAGMVIYFRYLKQRHRKRIATVTAVDIETSGGNSDEIVRYMDIIEVDNVVTPSQENSTQFISTLDRSLSENRDAAQESAEISSASSSNDNNASEVSSESSDDDRNTSGNFNDGYEQPYTTLVANNQSEEEHVYLTTQQVSNNENHFENLLLGDSFVSTEEKSSLCKTKETSKDSANNVIDNDDGNNLIDKDKIVHRLNINLQRKDVEYVNLSLDQ